MQSCVFLNSMMHTIVSINSSLVVCLQESGVTDANFKFEMVEFSEKVGPLWELQGVYVLYELSKHTPA